LYNIKCPFEVSAGDFCNPVLKLSQEYPQIVKLELSQ